MHCYCMRLHYAHTHSQLVVVCGRNEALRAALAEKLWPENVRVVVLGFVPNMDAYMAAADLLVTKAGPGTIAEACAFGVPMVLSSYLPGQVYIYCLCVTSS
jgi:1,2-diacylglycerol 3-beta-galactosyltransferase